MRFASFMQRKLLHTADSKVSYLQIIGFLVILAGLIYLFTEQMRDKLDSKAIAADFFAIMLGFAFAFPDLLKDTNKGLSTMRIVVFMMVNVICIILLKIGWDDKTTSLRAIGLDQYWMGVIAFIFGAKATQSYFDSKMAVANAAASATQASAQATASQASTTTSPPAGADLDGCGVHALILTEDEDLPASEGGMK